MQIQFQGPEGGVSPLSLERGEAGVTPCCLGSFSFHGVKSRPQELFPRETERTSAPCPPAVTPEPRAVPPA